jgi:hypothetical protein
MARHNNARGGGGLESTTPPIGVFTALTGLFAFGAGIWLAVKQPRIAGICVLVAIFLAVVSDGASLIANPLLGLAVIGIGGYIGMSTRS